MLFLIKKGYYDFKPFEDPNLKEIEVYRISQRTVKDPKQMKHNKHDRENWYKEGENHRVSNGMITRDHKEKGWVMNCTIEDIKELSESFGHIRVESYADEYRQLDFSDLPVIRICQGYECD